MSFLRDVLLAVADEVRSEAALLNELDARAGDGDLGVTLEIGARALSEALPALEDPQPADVLQAAGRTLAREAPSTAGTLTATGLLRASRAVREEPDDAASALAAALAAAETGISERGKAQRGSRTMLDALGPAADAATEAARSGADAAAALAAAATAADLGARGTADMAARHGRAGWVPERAAGHEDAGARMVAMMLQAGTRALDKARP